MATYNIKFINSTQDWWHFGVYQKDFDSVGLFGKSVVYLTMVMMKFSGAWIMALPSQGLEQIGLRLCKLLMDS